MAATPPVFEFYVLDFMYSEDVQKMTTEEVGQYTLLLNTSWLLGKDCTLPGNRKDLARVARVKRVSPRVLKKFDLVETEWGPRFRNARLYEEWLRSTRVSENRSAAAMERWECPGDEWRGDLQSQIPSVYGEPTEEAEPQPLVVVGADDFLKLDIPPREVLLESMEHKCPVIYGQSINQIFAWRGTGKTNVALGITKALATGGTFLRWKGTRPCNVLYVEGELPAAQMQERMRLLVGETDGHARLITLDLQPDNEIPTLARMAGQRLIEDALDCTDVLILDSISSLFGISTNDEENWLQIQNWFKQLRSKGLAIIFLHHAGKSGLQRGHSRAEDMLDISIKLSQPRNYSPEQGLRCVLQFDKVRGTAMVDSAPLTISLETLNGEAVWKTAASAEEQKQQAFALYDTGASVRVVAEQLGVSVGKAQSLRAQWKKRDVQVPVQGVQTALAAANTVNTVN